MRSFFFMLLPLAAVIGCSVDLDDFVYDDDALAAELDDDGGDGDDSNLTVCEAFCVDSGKTCPFDTVLGYSSEDACVSLCEGYTEEELECRIVHLGYTQGKTGDEGEAAALTHCPHILEDGGGTCADARPTPCRTLCTGLQEKCPFGGSLAYADLDECSSLCASYTKEQLDCRLLHMSFVGDEPDVHCGHTLLDGGGQCEDATP